MRAPLGNLFQEDDAEEINMTPMLDVVFIMLIFFIVTATFLSETGIDLTQPPDDPNPPPSKSKPAIAVYVDETNRCSVDGRGTECDRVTLAVERILADKPGASIILKVNETAKHGTLIYLKDAFDARELPTKLEIIPGTAS